MGEGDGTVSSLRHPPSPLRSSIPRGGASTNDHIDILGSMSLNEIILKVATGVRDEIQDSLDSNMPNECNGTRDISSSVYGMN